MMQTNSSLPDNHAIRAVIFDLDGVLMDSEWLAFLAWRDVVEAHRASLDESAFEKISGLSDLDSAEILMAHAGISLDVDKEVAWVRQRIVGQLAGEIEELPGAARLIGELTRRALPLAIASNASTSFVKNALRGLKLAQYFNLCVGVDQVANPKPAPDVYLKAAGRLGVDPARCLAVEDSRVGMQAAVSAGMRVIAVPDRRARQDAYPEAWRVYASLLDVEKELDLILR